MASKELPALLFFLHNSKTKIRRGKNRRGKDLAGKRNLAPILAPKCPAPGNGGQMSGAQRARRPVVWCLIAGVQTAAPNWTCPVERAYIIFVFSIILSTVNIISAENWLSKYLCEYFFLVLRNRNSNSNTIFNVIIFRSH